MQLSEKYKENFNVSSEGPSSGRLVILVYPGSCSYSSLHESMAYTVSWQVDVCVIALSWRFKDNTYCLISGVLH
jgi:hypothetical protein